MGQQYVIAILTQKGAMKYVGQRICKKLALTTIAEAYRMPKAKADEIANLLQVPCEVLTVEAAKQTEQDMKEYREKPVYCAKKQWVSNR